MSGFTGGGGGGGPGPGGCATDVYAGYVQMGTQVQIDQRVALGGSGCPLVIRPDRNRLRLVTIGNGVQFLNVCAGVGVGVAPNDAGSRAVDWQAFRTAANQVASAYYSVAVGASNRVDGVRSLAVGYQNIVNAYTDGVALGQYNTVNANSGVAIGRTSVVNSANGVAIGTATVNGIGGVAIGLTAVVNALNGVAVGRTATVGIYGTQGIAVGFGSGSNAPSAVAVGPGAQATGAYSNAWGYNATSRQPRTTNITAPIITRRDNGEILGVADLAFSGANVLIMFPEIAWDVVADYTLPLFAGIGAASMWIEEVGLILTTLGAPVVVQPTVRFGTIATPGKWLAPTLCTLLTALRMRERFNLLLTDDPEVDLSFGITVAGTPPPPPPGGPTVNWVRPYFRGHLVEDE